MIILPMFAYRNCSIAKNRLFKYFEKHISQITKPLQTAVYVWFDVLCLFASTF